MNKILFALFLLTACSIETKKVSNSVVENFNPKPLKISKDDSFFWGISTYKYPDEYDVYGLDLFDSKDSDILKLKSMGKKLICYMSAHYEQWREDAKDFPMDLLKGRLGGWAGEQVIDVRQWDKIKPIFVKRIKKCRDKGFDYVEFDNTDQRVSGVTHEDIVIHVRRLAKIAHSLDMGVMQKNMSEHTNELSNYLDGAIVESCNEYNECDNFKVYSDKNMPVFMVEYKKSMCKVKDFGSTYLAPSDRILDGDRWLKCN